MLKHLKNQQKLFLLKLFRSEFELGLDALADEEVIDGALATTFCKLDHLLGNSEHSINMVKVWAKKQPPRPRAFNNLDELKSQKNH